jgi:hypothetical protein
MKYVIYEKNHIERLGKLIDDETNIGEGDNVKDVIYLLKKLRNCEIKKSVVYNSIKTKQPIKNKYFIFKMKD